MVRRAGREAPRGAGRGRLSSGARAAPGEPCLRSGARSGHSASRRKPGRRAPGGPRALSGPAARAGPKVIRALRGVVAAGDQGGGRKRSWKVFPSGWAWEAAVLGSSTRAPNRASLFRKVTLVTAAARMTEEGGRGGGSGRGEGWDSGRSLKVEPSGSAEQLGYGAYEKGRLRA